MRYSLSEYILYINLKVVARLIQALPIGLALFIGRALGAFYYWMDSKHARVAYQNLRIALSEKHTTPQLRAILKKNYQNLGMDVIEALRLPRLNKNYINQYITIKGKQHLDKAFTDSKGAIVLGAHFGSWETCFAIAGMLGYPSYIVTEEQTKKPLLDRYLDHIRQSHGVKVLKVGEESRQAIRVLQEGKFVGMVADHGIKEGALVDFFGRKTRTPTAALKLSLKFGAPILMIYIRRIKGPRHELVIMPPLEMKTTGNLNQDVNVNLQTINQIIQSYIAKYPDEYLWFYKRFKYSSQRNILILYDGKTGHLRQAQAVTRLIGNIARQKDLEVKTKLINIDFKNKSAAILQSLSVSLANRHSCLGCLWCLKTFLKPDTFKELQSYFADIVISCGSSASAVNFVISSENQAKSIVLMRPGQLSTNRFNLVIAPYHDSLPHRDNIVVTEGALNLVDEEYIESQVRGLAPQVRIEKDLVLGLLLGGDTKKFKLSPGLLKPLISQIKLFLERYDGQILITTSRRTSPEAEELIKREFGNYSRCNLLVIANEKNIPEAVGGILGLSKIVIISPESISMISEAASSGRYVVVFSPQANIGHRHTRFLEHFAKEKYIYLTDSSRIAMTLDEIITRKPKIMKLQDSLRVSKALERLI
jgi:KDO2-lipid IV(A) lauroyltransferase